MASDAVLRLLPPSFTDALGKTSADLRKRRHPDSSAIARDVAQLFTSALSTLGGAAVARDAADALTVADFLGFVATVHAHLLLADRHAYVVSGLCARVAAVTREEAAKRAAAKAAPATAAAAAGGDSGSALSEAARAIREARAAAVAAVAPSAGGGAAAADSSAASSLSDDALGRTPLTPSLRDAVGGVLAELLDELDTASSSIQSVVPDVFQEGEAVLVQGVAGGGPSSLPLARALLLAAAKKRHVELFVTEGTAPDVPAAADASAGGAGEPPGHALALGLARSASASSSSAPKPVSRVVVPDASTWALLSSRRMGKVVLPARAVAVDGSAVVDAGGYGLAVAAHHHGVPVVVVASSLEVLPAHPRDADLRLDTAASGNPTGPGGAPPALEVALSAAVASGNGVAPLPPVLVQTLELVPAALVSWLVTNDGVAAPAQVPRLVEDAYGNGSGSVPAA